jgi:2-polyprenyl-6-methoxyphenol hydroxylase-like FAD-dependent oxidoreductase
MSVIRRVLIVGGGVGGLVCGLSFAQHGVEVVLIERRPAFDVPGVGLGQPANALRVYDSLGVLDEILAAGFIYDRMFLFDPNRDLIAEHKFLLGDDRIPAVCALSRLELHNILMRAAQRAGIEIRLGTTVTAIHNERDGASVELSDGRTERFDLVAGFDGIRSSMREHLFGSAFRPRPSGYGAWRLQVPRPNYVTGMEFLQGVGSKTGAMPLSGDLMYLFHIRPEAPGAVFEPQQFPDLLKERLAQYGDYVADISASLDQSSEIVYSAIEPLLLPWPWFRGRVAMGGDAAHTFPPHLTQGAAMAAEDGYVLAQEMVATDVSIEARLMSYSQKRYARCAFVYSFARQWLEDEQSVRTQSDLDEARTELRENASFRIGISDRILNGSFV